MPSFATTTMKAFADAACERKFAPVLKPHELIHQAIAAKKATPEAALDAAAALIQGAVLGAVAPRTLLLVSDNLPKHELLLDAETDNLQVIPSYFHADKLGEWKEAAFLPFLAGAAVVGGAIGLHQWAAGAGDENGDGSTSLAEARF